MFKNISEVKAANKALGHYFFTPQTMRFWRSRVETKLYGGQYFVTSEYYAAALRYTIRQALEDGSIKTISEFKSRGEAIDKIKELIKQK